MRAFKDSGHKRAGGSGERQGDDLGAKPSRGRGLLGWTRRQEGPGRRDGADDKGTGKGHRVTERCAEEEEGSKDGDMRKRKGRGETRKRGRGGT